MVVHARGFSNLSTFVSASFQINATCCCILLPKSAGLKTLTSVKPKHFKLTNIKCHKHQFTYHSRNPKDPRFCIKFWRVVGFFYLPEKPRIRDIKGSTSWSNTTAAWLEWVGVVWDSSLISVSSFIRKKNTTFVCCQLFRFFWWQNITFMRFHLVYQKRTYYGGFIFFSFRVFPIWRFAYFSNGLVKTTTNPDAIGPSWSAPPTPGVSKTLTIGPYGCQPKNRGILPSKWMVKIMENPLKNGMIWGENASIFGLTPIFRHVCNQSFVYMSPRKQQCDASTSSRAPRFN